MYTYIWVALCAYLIGGISPSLIIAKAKKKDIREHGTGNLGASNTTILLGWKWGVLVGVIDILKAFIPVVIVKYFMSDVPYIEYVVATSVILGHIFPFYLKFKGGKGLASFFGAMLGLNWLAFVIIGLIFLIVTFVTDYIVIGTYTVTTLFPIYLGVVYKDLIMVGIILIATLIIYFKHRMNVVRIIKKEEVGLKAAFSGKHKI